MEGEPMSIMHSNEGDRHPVTRNLTPIEILRGALDQIEDAQRRADIAQRTADEAKARGEVNSARLDALEGRHGWFSALAYAKLHGLPTYLGYTQRLGRAASIVAAAAGVQPHKVECGRWGKVNSYPESIWDGALRQLSDAA
jgi:hypothetical protein